MTIPAFSNIVLPFADTLATSGGLTPYSCTVPRFLFATNSEDTYSVVSFTNASGYAVAPGQGALLFVQPDGTHQEMLGSPFLLETGLPPPRE